MSFEALRYLRHLKRSPYAAPAAPEEGFSSIHVVVFVALSPALGGELDHYICCSVDRCVPRRGIAYSNSYLSK